MNQEKIDALATAIATQLDFPSKAEILGAIIDDIVLAALGFFILMMAIFSLVAAIVLTRARNEDALRENIGRHLEQADMLDDSDPVERRAMCKDLILAERDRCLDVVEDGRQQIGVLSPDQILDYIRGQIEAITP